MGRELSGGHVEYVCSDQHQYPGGCQFCDGGLTACGVCEAFEGAWTSECPKARVPGQTWGRVYRGEVDYIGGRWISAPSPWSPYGRERIVTQIRELARTIGYEVHLEPIRRVAAS